MRKLFLSLTCFVTLSAEQMYLYEVSPIIGITENGTSSGLQRSVAYGVEFQYNDVDFFIKPELTYIHAPNIQLHMEDEKVNGHLLMINGVYDVEYTDLLTPFLKAGIGYQSISDKPTVNSDAFVVGAGAGFKLHVHNNISIKFEAIYTVQDFSSSNILAFTGVNFAFGNEANIPAAIEVSSMPEEVNTTVTPKVAPAVVVVPETVYISKADLNLTEPSQSHQEVAIRDANHHIKSLTLFVPYHFRGYTLDDDSKTLLYNYAKELRGTTSAITVIGHTDSKGRRAYNQELSLKRAHIVKELFVDYGIEEERISIEGRGESEPIADSKNPAANKLNKRIEIKIKN